MAALMPWRSSTWQALTPLHGSGAQYLPGRSASGKPIARLTGLQAEMSLASRLLAARVYAARGAAPAITLLRDPQCEVASQGHWLSDELQLASSDVKRVK